MKRLLRSLLLAAVLTAALCVGALAAEPTAAGIYAVTGGNGVTLTPQTAGQSVITAETQETYGADCRRAVSAAGGQGEDRGAQREEHRVHRPAGGGQQRQGELQRLSQQPDNGLVPLLFCRLWQRL